MQSESVARNEGAGFEQPIVYDPYLQRSTLFSAVRVTGTASSMLAGRKELPDAASAPCLLPTSVDLAIPTVPHPVKVECCDPGYQDMPSDLSCEPSSDDMAMCSETHIVKAEFCVPIQQDLPFTVISEPSSKDVAIPFELCVVKSEFCNQQISPEFPLQCPATNHDVDLPTGPQPKTFVDEVPAWFQVHPSTYNQSDPLTTKPLKQELKDNTEEMTACGMDGPDSVALAGNQPSTVHICENQDNINMFKSPIPEDIPCNVDVVSKSSAQKSINCHKCQACGKDFTCRKQLSRHTRSHASDILFVCEICNKGFVAKEKFTRHMLIHVNGRPFKCSICGKAFKCLSFLTTHVYTHSNARPFKCGTCGKAFNQSSHLSRHKLSHSDSKPFKCTMCCKAYRYSSNLKTHLRTHSDSRPLKCATCGKAFIQPSHLKKHSLTHMISSKTLQSV